MIDHDPARATGHWRRYRRLLAIAACVALATILIALFVLHREGVVLRLNFVVALTLGIGVSIMLAGVLMGLVFVSASSGHDADVERPRPKPGPPRGPWQF